MVPSRFAPILRHPPIYRDGNELVGLYVLELHHLMSSTRAGRTDTACLDSQVAVWHRGSAEEMPDPQRFPTLPPRSFHPTRRQGSFNIRVPCAVPLLFVLF